MISYQEFLRDIDIVFNLPEEHKNPQERPPLFDYTVAYLDKKPEEEDGEKLMKRLGEVARKHKLLLKPYFQDKDIAKIGRVSFTRMRSILDNNKLPLTDRQFDLLCKDFSYEGKEFNYVEFIEVLKKSEKDDETKEQENRPII